MNLAAIFSLGRQVSQSAAALAAAEAAYHAGGTAEAVLGAAIAATPTLADDDATEGVAELVRMLGESSSALAGSLESVSQGAATVAMNLREVESFLARLRGRPLREVLGDA